MTGEGIGIRTSGIPPAEVKGLDAIAAHLSNALYEIRCAIRWTDDEGAMVQCDGTGAAFCFGIAPKAENVQLVGIPLCDDHDDGLAAVHTALMKQAGSLEIRAIGPALR